HVDDPRILERLQNPLVDVTTDHGESVPCIWTCMSRRVTAKTPFPAGYPELVLADAGNRDSPLEELTGFVLGHPRTQRTESFRPLVLLGVGHVHARHPDRERNPPVKRSHSRTAGPSVP